MAEVMAPEAAQNRRRTKMRALAHKPMTAEEFLYAYQGVEGRWELVDGEPQMMAGGTLRHSQIARNLIIALGTRLRGSSCQPFGSDMGVNVTPTKVRQPDVSVLCDPRDTDVGELQQAHYPTILFEVFSPSTGHDDRGIKLREYMGLQSVQAVVHIHPGLETVELHERVGPNEWRRISLESGASLRLTSIGIELSGEDIFRRD